MEFLLLKTEELLSKAKADFEEAIEHCEEARSAHASARCIVDATRGWMQDLIGMQRAIAKQLGRDVPDIPLTRDQE